MRISSPPTVGQCYYGVDTPKRRELIAANQNVEAIQRYITADSLSYLSQAGLYIALKESPAGFCDACFSDRYPVPVGARPKGSQLGLFELDD